MRRPNRKGLLNGGIHVLEPAKSMYHIWEPDMFSHRCKLRPFCAEFLHYAMLDFEVHFNTAATRLYGLRIIEVLKAEILVKVPVESQSPVFLKQLDVTFNE
mmetsp:Transcript_823/g.1242  ORF Transcript_823/g.1242 Transcript_823/m.1242 type:complete len:101 (+) Transcript_823:551-853(+)